MSGMKQLDWKFWAGFLLLMFAGVVFGQQPKPPAITDAVKVKFFKAQAEMEAAQAALHARSSRQICP